MLSLFSSRARLAVTLLALASIASAAACGAPSARVAPAPPPTAARVRVQLLAFNDFHGNLEPSRPPKGHGLSGGAAYLAAHVAQRRAANPSTLVVSAGDLFGASPLVSSLFHDEPTVEVMNELGLDVHGVGNHEFDEGPAELLRMKSGGCHPKDGCQGTKPFSGAKFTFLAANVVESATGKTLFPSYAVHRVGGVDIGVIGLTLEGTPSVVTASGVAGLTFRDEVETVNAAVKEIRARGVETIVVVVHEGGTTTGSYDACEGLSGAIVAIANGIDDAVDVIVSGHTHAAYNCTLGKKIVTSAGCFGHLLTGIDLEIDTRTRDVVHARAENRIVTNDVAPDPAVAAIVARYATLAAPRVRRVVGAITATLASKPSSAGEAPLGDVVADAMLAATADAKAVIAFMNTGGVRADIDFSRQGAKNDGEVTYGELFTAQPFENTLVTMTLTGKQIHELLEQQLRDGRDPALQVSAGFSYRWKRGAPAGARVDPADIKLRGATLAPDATYRVTVNSYLAGGGSGCTVLRQGTDRVEGGVDLAALETYMRAHSPVAPPPATRVAVLP